MARSSTKRTGTRQRRASTQTAKTEQTGGNWYGTLTQHWHGCQTAIGGAPIPRQLQQDALAVLSKAMSSASSMIAAAEFSALGRTATAPPGNAGTEAARPTRTRRTQQNAPAQRRSRSNGATELTELQRNVLAQVPDSGGVQQSAIKVRGARPNIIGRAVSRLKGMGLLIEQNGVLERAATEAERRAA